MLGCVQDTTLCSADLDTDLEANITRALKEATYYTYFPYKTQITAASTLGTLASTLARHSGAVLSTGITNRKCKNAGVAPDRPRGGHAMAAAAPEAQGRAVPFGAQPDTRVSGQQHQSLCRSAHIWETGKVLRVLIWGLLINFSRQTNSQNSQRQHHERG